MFANNGAIASDGFAADALARAAQLVPGGVCLPHGYRKRGAAVNWVGWTAGVTAALAVGYLTCAVKLFLTPSQRAFQALKNRTAIPRAVDIDPAVTLDALLATDNDRERWSEHRAAVVEGYVVRVIDGGIEVANCLSFTRRDAHVELALTPSAPPTARVITEITPRMRDTLASRGVDWSTPTLLRTILGKRVRIEGWLLFDRGHDDEAENTRPGARGNWRATAWEIHPITSLTVLP